MASPQTRPHTTHTLCDCIKFNLQRLELIDDDGNFYVFTDVGYMRDGDWTTTGNTWQKGVCIMQFNRTCPADKAQVI